MNRESKQYSPAEFRDKLKREVDHPKPIFFVGMIKTAEDDQHMMFAQGVTCAHWTVVPLDRIESIQVISETPCKDHSHPLVKMVLIAPASEEALMYASLAQSNAFMNSASQSIGDTGDTGLAMMQRLKDLRNGKREMLFRNSGPDVWFRAGAVVWMICLNLPASSPPTNGSSGLHWHISYAARSVHEDVHANQASL